MSLLRRLTGADRRAQRRAHRRDVLLTLAVLGDEATPEQDAEFDRRYVEDDAFYAVAAPVIAVWDGPANWADLAAEVQRTRRGAVARWLSGIWMMVSIWSIIVTGAAALSAAVLILVSSQSNTEPDRALGSWPVPVTADSLAAVADSASRRVVVPRPARPESERYARTLLKVLDISGRGVSDANVATLLEFEHGSRVLVGAHSGVRYATSPGGLLGIVVELTAGDLSLRVTREDRQVNVVTPAGIAALGPGSYALRCTRTYARCGELDVAVARGRGRLRMGKIDGPGVTLGDRTFARVRRHEVPVLVPKGAASGFPVINPLLFARTP